MSTWRYRSESLSRARRLRSRLLRDRWLARLGGLIRNADGTYAKGARIPRSGWNERREAIKAGLELQKVDQE